MTLLGDGHHLTMSDLGKGPNKKMSQKVEKFHDFLDPPPG